MINFYLFGDPVYFEGQYKEDKVYPLYIQQLACRFKLKKNKIPTIQIKNSKFYFGNEYLEQSGDEIEILTLTSVDLKLFLEQYDVFELTYISGWKFKGIKGLFKPYIDKWIKVKNEATISRKQRKKNTCKTNVKQFIWKICNFFSWNFKISNDNT